MYFLVQVTLVLSIFIPLNLDILHKSFADWSDSGHAGSTDLPNIGATQRYAFHFLIRQEHVQILHNSQCIFIVFYPILNRKSKGNEITCNFCVPPISKAHPRRILGIVVNFVLNPILV